MTTTVPAAPPPDLRFRRRITVLGALRELWRVRELLRSVTERDLRVRYKQAVLGFAWAIATPLALMLVFTVFFQRVADVDTGGESYALFSYLGLLPWAFFSTSVSQGGLSLVNNVALLNKVACPREVFPIGSVGVATADLLASLPALLALFAVTGTAPQVESLWFPVLLVVQVAFTVAAALVVSAVVVYLRDVRHALPVLLQVGLFATPVAYGIEVVPTSLRTLYVVLNPLAAVIDGYRDTILLGSAPDWDLLGPAAGSSLVLLLVAFRVFKRMEMGFADVA